MKTFEIPATSGRITFWNSRVIDSISNHTEIKLNSVCGRSGAVRVKMVDIKKYPNRTLDLGLRKGPLSAHQLIEFFYGYKANLYDFQFFAPVSVRGNHLIADVRLIVALNGRERRLGIHLYTFSDADLSRFMGRWVFLERKSTTT